jgi:glycosyltransferase involved in cell wall biosynthesis
MTSWPKLSIITPSFNQGSFLEHTINSVLSQGYPNLEYIIIDGGSTDHSLEIIERYETSLAYWVSEPDRGQGDAINKGFERATGDVIAWINSDDCYTPNAFQRAVSFLMQHPHVGCVMGDLTFMDDQGHTLYTRKSIPFDFNTALFGGAMVPQPTTFFTREALARTGLIDVDLNYLLDYEFFLRMSRAGIAFGLIREPLAAFRLHTESKTVGSYQDSFWTQKAGILRSYAPGWLPGWGYSSQVIRLLKWAFRARSWCIRAVTRGDIRPFQVTALRLQAE